MVNALFYALTSNDHLMLSLQCQTVFFCPSVTCYFHRFFTANSWESLELSAQDVRYDRRAEKCMLAFSRERSYYVTSRYIEAIQAATSVSSFAASRPRCSLEKCAGCFYLRGKAKSNIRNGFLTLRALLDRGCKCTTLL